MGRARVRFGWRMLAVPALLAGFLLVWAAIAFAWPVVSWFGIAGYAALALALLAAFVVTRRRRGSAAPELYASDAYSDIQLGRPPATHYPHDPASASQIGDPPHRGDSASERG